MIRATRNIFSLSFNTGKKWLVFFVIPFITLVNIYSQEINFTMFYENPVFMNPALTGDYKGDWRLTGNFRNQWSAASDPFRTASVSFDKRIYLFNQKFGVGLLMLNDESGIGGLTYNKVYVSVSYERVFNNHYIRAGLQGGMVFGSFNSWTVWDDATGSFTAASGEAEDAENVSYPDIHLGLSWKRNIHIFEPEAGVALAHVNSPTKSFYGEDDKEGLKIALHAKIKVKFNDKIYLTPAMYYATKDKSNQSIFGTRLGYQFLNKRLPLKRVYGGVFLRNGIVNGMDALAVNAGITIRRIDLGFNYDFNISDLSGSGGSLGTFELSFMYRSLSTVLNSYSIPCERY